MLMFPDYLDGAKVLEYTDAGHFGFITDYDDDDNPYEREICYLAICAYTGDPSRYLFYCDRYFEVISDFCGDSAAGYKDSCPDAVWHAKNPPYLYTAAQRKARGGTLYFEFQRGRFHHKHWLDRSIYMDAELFDYLKLYELFSNTIPHFDYYYYTEVTPSQYEALKAAALAQGGETADLFRELDYWVQDCFFTENVFTICGI